MAVTKRLRYEILRRDNHTCRYCGGAAPDVKLTVDHVIPSALGGGDEATNLVTACADCNAGKTSTSPDAPIVADVNQDALRWARAMEVAAAIQRGKFGQVQMYVDTFDEEWRSWGSDESPPERSPDWRRTIERFFEAGLEFSRLTDAVERAMTAHNIPTYRVWRYFCGICWTIIRERTEMAAGMVTSDEGGQS